MGICSHLLDVKYNLGLGSTFCFSLFIPQLFFNSYSFADILEMYK